MDPFQILRENMFRFKTKNLINEQQVEKDIHPEYPLSYWEKNYTWFPGKLKPVKLTDADGVAYKYKQMAKVIIPKSLAKNLDAAWKAFVKRMKSEYPVIYAYVAGGKGSESMGIVLNKDYNTADDYVVILIGPKKRTLDAAVITANDEITWDALTNKGWRSLSSADADSIPLNNIILRTNIYVTGPATAASHEILPDELANLAFKNGISSISNNKFRRAGGRVIYRTNLEDINHPGKPSQLQYMVVFINSEDYTETRNELYPNIMDNIFKPYGNVPKAQHINVIES